MSEIEKALYRATTRYNTAKEKLKNMVGDDSALAIAAQEANEAYLELRTINTEFQNYSFSKKLGDLYGC